MSLWHLMVAITCVIFVVGAIQAAHFGNAGTAGYAVATIVGLLLAASNAWAVSRIADAVDARIKQFPASLQESYLQVLYLGTFVWMLLAVFIAGWISSAILRLVI